MTDKTPDPCGSVSSNQLGNCPCQPMLMFDRQGNPRTRYVRISHNGAHMVMTPKEAQCFKEESEISGDETPYILTDTYLSAREFEDLPEFEGF
jgi:hypothetical protein